MNGEPGFNIDKQIAYWRDGALDTWKDAEYSLSGRRIAFALFAAHLSVEKALKAHVVKTTRNLPPMIHNLVALANLANLTVSQKHMDYLTELNPMNIVSRYPGENVSQIPPYEYARTIIEHAKEVLEWLIKKL